MDLTIINAAYNDVPVKQKLENLVFNNFLFISKETNVYDLFSIQNNKKKIINKLSIDWKLHKKRKIIYNNEKETRVGYKKGITINIDNLYIHNRILHYFHIHSIVIYIEDEMYIPKDKNIFDTLDYFIHIPSNYYLLNKKVSRIDIEYEEYNSFETIIFEKNGYLRKDLILGIDLNDYRFNLISHVLPKKSNMIDINMTYIKKNINLFNGVRVISIAQDENFESNEYLNNWINFDDFKIINVCNSVEYGEQVSFKKLLDSIKNNDENEFTFYCHSKGVQKRNDGNPFISIWIELMYKYCLSNIDTVIYHNKLFGGAIRSYKKFPNTSFSPNWHYTGTFYWFSNKIFSMDNIYSYIKDTYFATEMFPGLISNVSDSICFLKDNSLPFYECFFEENKECIKNNFDLLEFELSKSIKKLF